MTDQASTESPAAERNSTSADSCGANVGVHAARRRKRLRSVEIRRRRSWDFAVSRTTYGRVFDVGKWWIGVEWR